MNKTTYREYLGEHGELTLTNVGVSMLPMLRQGRDMFTLARKTEARCRKYDVVLYLAPSGDYVLHRIVKVRPQDYVILGDNCLNKEYGIRDEHILGVLIRFVHRGREYSADHKGYRAYAAVWYWLYPLRRLAKKLISLMRGRK